MFIIIFNRPLKISSALAILIKFFPLLAWGGTSYKYNIRQFYKKLGDVGNDYYKNIMIIIYLFIIDGTTM